MRWRHVALSLSALCVLTWAPTRPADRYRPKDMADLVSHEDIISTITRLIDAGKLPHLLLYGPPGTGKTSTILACAHTLYGKHFNSMVLELNASDDRGIDGDRLRRNPPSRCRPACCPCDRRELRTPALCPWGYREGGIQIGENLNRCCRIDN